MVGIKQTPAIRKELESKIVSLGSSEEAHPQRKKAFTQAEKKKLLPRQIEVQKMYCKAMFILEEVNEINYLPQQSKRATLSLEMGNRVSDSKGLLQNLREMQVLRPHGLFLAWLSTTSRWYRAGSQMGEVRSASQHACQDKEEGHALLWGAAGLGSWGAATTLVVERRDKGSGVGHACWRRSC